MRCNITRFEMMNRRKCRYVVLLGSFTHHELHRYIPTLPSKTPTHSSSFPPVISSAITSPGSWPVQTVGRQGFGFLVCDCLPTRLPNAYVIEARSHHGPVIIPRAATARDREQVFNVQNVHSGSSARAALGDRGAA